MAQEFAVGQIYHCPTPIEAEKGASKRPGILFQIGRIDELQQGAELTIVISVSVRIDLEVEVKEWPNVTHMPFMQDAVINTDCHLTDRPEPLIESEEFDDGYNTWREAWDAGDAGAFTLTVPEAYFAILQTLHEGEQHL